MKSYFLLFTLLLSVSACGDEDSADTLDACNNTCTDDQVCDDRNPSDSFCADRCDETSCSGDKPDCNEGNKDAPVGLCVCNDESCPQGQVCNADGSCAEDPNACENTGESGCLTQQQLCQTNPEDDTNYNQCVSPQEVNNTCNQVVGHRRDDNGPIILSVTYQKDLETTLGEDQDPCQSIRQFVARVFLPDEDVDIQSSLFTERLKLLDPNDGSDGSVYSEGPSTDSHPSLGEPNDTDNTVELTFTLCLADSTQPQAVYLKGEKEDENNIYNSNAMCFSVE